MSGEMNKALVRRFSDGILNKRNMAFVPELIAEEYLKLDSFSGTAKTCELGRDHPQGAHLALCMSEFGVSPCVLCRT